MAVIKLVPDDEDKEVKENEKNEESQPLEEPKEEENKEDEVNEEIPEENKEETNEIKEMEEDKTWDDKEDTKTWDDEDEDFIGVGDFEMKEPKEEENKEDEEDEEIGDIKDLIETIIIILLVIIAYQYRIEAKEEIVYKFIKKRERQLKRICEKVDKVLKRTEYYKKLAKMNDYTFLMDVFLLVMSFKDELDEMQKKQVKKVEKEINEEKKQEILDYEEEQKPVISLEGNNRLKLLIGGANG